MTMTSKRIQVVVVTANSESLFPINTLRNTGIRQVITSHYAVTDMDLWPSCTLSSLIHNSMTLQESFSLSNPISTLSIEESISSHHL